RAKSAGAPQNREFQPPIVRGHFAGFVSKPNVFIGLSGLSGVSGWFAPYPILCMHLYALYSYPITFIFMTIYNSIGNTPDTPDSGWFGL
ncbi:MAG: hypothetical protein ABGZ35_24760, partial [Planctomycetaceae bacterium]